MTGWRKWLTWGLVTAGLCFLIGFVKQYHIPRLERWLLQEVEKQSSAHTPLRIWPESVKVAFFPPGLVLNNLRVLPKGELKSILAPGVVHRAEIRVNWLHLLTGRLRLSYIGISGAEIKVIVKDSVKGKPGSLRDFKYDFSKFSEIPIDELEIDELAVWARLEAFKTSVHLDKVRLNIENRSRNFLVDLEAPQSQIKWQDANDPIPISLDTRMLFDAKGVRLSSFKIKTGDSFVVAAGTATDKVDMQTRTQIKLQDVARWERILRDPKLPLMNGEVRADIAIAGPYKNPQLRGKVNGTDVKVDKFLIGKVVGQGTWQDQTVKLDELIVENSAGLATVKNASWKVSDGENLSADVTTNGLEVGELLNNLGIKDVPVKLEVSGQFKCSGPLLGNLRVQCEGNIGAKNLLVHSGKPEKKTIVDIAVAKAKGDFAITTSAVSFDADVQIGNKSTGRSKGSVDYQKGFLISYEGDNVDFSDVRNLANLKLEGSARIKGTTEGTSKAGTLRLDAQAKNIWLDDYWLGHPEAEVTYKKGILQFNKMLGQAGTSRYTGNLSINFQRNEIFIQARSPYTDLIDIKDVFKRKVDLPIAIGGTGSVDVKAWGPLKFNQMSYQMRSAFYRGHLANESFDQMIFNMVADEGQAKAEKVVVARGQSSVEVTGTITPSGLIDSVLVGRRLRLEESENVSRLGVDITGQVDMTMTIRGQLPKPVFDAHGRLSQLFISDKSAADSTFKLKLSNDRLEGGGRFIGDVVTADFVIPLSDNAPFSLKAKTSRWNFANSFSIFSNAARQRDIQTSLTTTIDIQSEKGGFEKASGEIAVNEISLKRGAIGIRNLSPIRFFLKSGTVTANLFSLEGEGGFLKGSIAELNSKNLRASLNGKLDLSLMTLFTPFLADLQGRLALNVNFAGQTTSPLVTGSAYVDQGVVRLKGFPHPFTNLRSDIIFSEQGLNINALRADLGGGTVTGEGKVRWLGKEKVPVDVKGIFTDVTLNIPENFRSRGSGAWGMKGDFFPYTIAVNYEVTGGEITAEFGGASLGGVKTVAPSALLPKFLVQSADQPVNLDINLQLKNPLLIRNSMIESLIRGNLRVVGPPNQPKLTGVLTPAPGGKFFFRDVPFDVQTGFVEYNDDPPENPKIYLTAQAVKTENVRDEGTATNRQNEYEISLLVQGRLQPKPKITLSSLPALSEKDIVSLLALGMTPTALDQNRTGTVAASNSVQYGAAILQKPLGKEVRNRLGLDMSLSQVQAAGDTTSYPKLTFTKVFSPKLNASASRTVEKNPTNSAKMEYKFNRGVSGILSWDSRDSTSKEETSKDVEQSVFGLDLEFKVNFR